MCPLLSIVIVNYNYGRFLETAIQSVLSQKDFHLCELIVVDGGSHDQSVEIIKRHSGEISWWCSEKDEGQSDAFVKGFSHARGVFFTWLNADDVMLPGTVCRLKEAVKRNPLAKWFVGGCVHTDPDLRVVKCTRARRFSEYEARHGVISVYSPSSFFSREMYHAVGGIDRRFHYSMDTDLWFRFRFKAGEKYCVMPGYMFGFRFHENSKTTCVHFKKGPAEFHRNPRSEREKEIIRELVPCSGKMPLLARAVRFDWKMYLLSWWDTLLYKNKLLLSVDWEMTL